MLNTETQANQWSRLFAQDQAGNFMAHVQQRDFLDKFGEMMQTVRTEGELDAENGKGFKTTIRFSDGSSLVSSEIYLTDDKEQIAFEKRP